MFGNKAYKKAKEKIFEKEKKKKQFFAIREYYKKKDAAASKGKQSKRSK